MRRKFDMIAARWLDRLGRSFKTMGRARSQGERLGRPTLPADKEAKMRELLAGGTGIVKAARLAGVGVSAVQRIKAVMPAGAVEHGGEVRP